MSLIETVVEGTLKPDGTLELDEKPNLPSGRVTVVLRQQIETKTPQPLGDEFFQHMEQIWSGQKARGFIPRSVEEVENERRMLRDESEVEIREAIRIERID
jgi:hypothetical protein